MKTKRPLNIYGCKHFKLAAPPRLSTTWADKLWVSVQRKDGFSEKPKFRVDIFRVSNNHFTSVVADVEFDSLEEVAEKVHAEGRNDPEIGLTISLGFDLEMKVKLKKLFDSNDWRISVGSPGNIGGFPQTPKPNYST